MSKQIITNGKYRKITCSDCGCVFVFAATDVEKNGMVTCPECDTENKPTVKAVRASKASK